MAEVQYVGASRIYPGNPVPAVNEATETCEAYCDLVLSQCTAANTIFPDVAPCLQACAAYPVAGAPGDAVGDTLQCRMFYASVAHVRPRLFCRAAGPGGGGQCVAARAR